MKVVQSKNKKPRVYATFRAAGKPTVGRSSVSVTVEDATPEQALEKFLSAINRQPKPQAA